MHTRTIGALCKRNNDNGAAGAEPRYTVPTTTIELRMDGVTHNVVGGD